jgi:hypothetical protein
MESFHTRQVFHKIESRKFSKGTIFSWHTNHRPKHHGATHKTHRPTSLLSYTRQHFVWPQAFKPQIIGKYTTGHKPHRPPSLASSTRHHFVVCKSNPGPRTLEVPCSRPIPVQLITPID